VLGLDNVPIEGEDRYSVDSDFMTMQRVGLMQAFPNPSKRRAREAKALAQVDVMRMDDRVQRQTVLRETALAWISRQTWERQLDQVAQLQSENRLFADVVNAQLTAASGSTVDALLPQEEAADIASLHDQIISGREQAIAQLRRWIGAQADLPLGGDIPHWEIDRAVLSHQLHQHPELLSFDSRERLLDADIAQARSAKIPDWDVSVAWLGRGSGYSDMAMLEVRVDLPVFQGTRQDPTIASKIAQRSALDAKREATLREHTAMLETDAAEYRRLEKEDQRFTNILLPLADEKVALTMATWRSGQGSLLDVISARRERIATRLKAIANAGAMQEVAAQLHYAYSDVDVDVDSEVDSTGELP
jgi:outer membrane protein TolC